MAWAKSPFRGQFVRVAVKAATDAGLTVKSVLINTANGDIKLDIDNAVGQIGGGSNPGADDKGNEWNKRLEEIERRRAEEED